MNVKQPISCTVVSYPDSNGGTIAHLRLGHGEEVLTLPVRKVTQEHRSYVLATWVKSYLPMLRKWLGFKDSGGGEAKQAELHWEDSYVVTSPDDDFTVHAWVNGGPGLLRYVYVPPDLRGKGIARALIAHVCGSPYQYGKPWPFKRPPTHGTYNPYVLCK